VNIIEIASEPALGADWGSKATPIHNCRPGATHRQAAFAFQLARLQTGLKDASYKPGAGSRAGLMELPEFAAAFVSAKARIREMDYRYVAESDQTCQALLEIYCSVALATPFNDFGTH
jgi:hypothetical protein